jgi:hypothetical protein
MDDPLGDAKAAAVFTVPRKIDICFGEILAVAPEIAVAARKIVIIARKFAVIGREIFVKLREIFINSREFTVCSSETAAKREGAETDGYTSYRAVTGKKR